MLTVDGGPIAAKALLPALLATLLATGCAMAPSAMLVDSASDRAVVRLAYGVLGPTIEVAEASTGLVARDHCEALGKSHELLSSRREATDRTRGEYVFFYACERPGDRRRDRKVLDPAMAEGIRELALPMIETSHAEARRHRR